LMRVCAALRTGIAAEVLPDVLGDDLSFFQGPGLIITLVVLILPIALLVTWGRENKRKRDEREAARHPPSPPQHASGR